MPEYTTGDEIREAFLRFFEEKSHKVIPSSSLIPQGDPTLLLTNAGMVQIKPYFLGESTPPSPRLASCQKCFRTSDIDSVGDNQHLTFFEMLGNFSVGDYFKKETISWAWEFVTQWLKLAPERLWISIFLDDEESFQHWRELGIPEEKIVRLGEDNNFWGPAGEWGPCGPCSEIHYDAGEEFGCGKPTCQPGCSCGRFIEIWNLVFTQYNQDREGKRSPLPRPNIDTGMGLERTAAVIQGKTSVYETDLLMPVIAHVSELSGHAYGHDESTDRTIRIVAEHARSITFLIADGIVPSNEGRGYVLRRILRRASLFGRKLGLHEPFLIRVAQTVIDKMGRVYPELQKNCEFTLGIIQTEEERFSQTLDSGLRWLDKSIQDAREKEEKVISGRETFMLYDTYGFPPELTMEVTAENGLSIDLAEFEREMELQRERARAAHRFTLAEGSLDEHRYEHLNVPNTEFTGYDRLSHDSVVVGLITNGKVVESAHEGDRVEVYLLETPFYGEMGGQEGDTGEIEGEKGKVTITDTTRLSPSLFTHWGRVTEGQISLNNAVEARVDEERRLDIARNHTATHLLQAALRRVLGSHVQQRGSLVAPDHLRFDFSHLLALSPEELLEVQHQVNQKIRQNLPVASKTIPYTEALACGAIALFGEKYGNVVRMIEIGDPPASIELCGGTHVNSTGEIGFFHITAESSIGSGMRRIEAVTGRGAEAFVNHHLSTLENIAKQLQTTPAEVQGKVSASLTELEKEHKRALVLERELLKNVADSLAASAESVNGITVLSTRVPASSMETMRETGDLLKERLKSGVIVLGAVYNNKPNFLAMVTPDLVTKGIHAGEIVKQVAKVTGGGGGGNPGMGQAGGKDKSKLAEALSLVRKLVQTH
jgi:alanyl-tRNA synthetase